MKELPRGEYLWLALTCAAIAATLVCVVGAYSLWKGAKHPLGQTASITVQGKHEVSVKPDVAEFTFNINESGSSVKDAQSNVEKKTAPLIESLKKLGVEEKDVKVTSYNVNPKYTYENCVPTVSSGYCQPKQKLDGYEVSEILTVKVRNIENAGSVTELAGSHSITNMSGPNFVVDDIDAVREAAKTKAILNAREKAQKMADALGVDLGSVMYINEDSYNPPYYSARAGMAMETGVQSSMSKDISVPSGESKVTVTVSVGYNIDQ